MSWKQFDVNILNHYFSWFIVKENDDKNSNVDQNRRFKSKSHQNLTDSSACHRAETRPVTHPAVFVYVCKKKNQGFLQTIFPRTAFGNVYGWSFFQIPRLQLLQGGNVSLYSKSK